MGSKKARHKQPGGGVQGPRRAVWQLGRTPQHGHARAFYTAQTRSSHALEKKNWKEGEPWRGRFPLRFTSARQTLFCSAFSQTMTTAGVTGVKQWLRRWQFPGACRRVAMASQGSGGPSLCSCPVALDCQGETIAAPSLGSVVAMEALPTQYSISRSQCVIVPRGTECRHHLVLFLGRNGCLNDPVDRVHFHVHIPSLSNL